MKKICIDIETKSSISLEDEGVYQYAASPDFDVLLFSYSIDGGPVNTIDLTAGELIPADILRAIEDPQIQKWAFNAQFERVCMSAYLLKHYADETDLVSGFLDPKGWRCDMVAASYVGLPLSLAGAGQVLKVELPKMTEGKLLIKKFCVPAKDGNWTAAEDDPEAWEIFKAYNKRDVETEMEIHDKIVSLAQIPEHLWDEYALDQRINDTGVRIDPVMVRAAVSIDEELQAGFAEDLKALTGLTNPKSPKQLKDWLADRGIQADSLDKKAVSELMKTAPPDVCAVLRLRQKASKSSTAKYKTMLDLRGKDDRVRGCFQFYGSHTGRWAGRHIQLQNLPQNHMRDLEEARKLVRLNDMGSLQMLYDNVPQVLSELIRTALIPSKGKKFAVADFSAIEARVLAWLAGEDWRLEVFRNGGDIYCASASQMFKVPVEKHGVNSHLRQKGKVAELALGYGGSVGALTAMGALENGMKESELKPLVEAWRGTNPHITALWWDTDAAVRQAITRSAAVICTKYGLANIGVYLQYDQLIIRLQSGRELIYRHPQVKPGKYGKPAIYYNGVGLSRQYCEIETTGARLVENIVQALARDLLAGAMARVSAKYPIVAHVHDEMIVEVPKDTAEEDLKNIIAEMCRIPTWGGGLVLNAAGYVCDFYQKD